MLHKTFFNNTLAAGPALGVTGGNGDRVILYAGTGGAYPYSIGIDNFTQYHSVPFGSVHKMFIAGANIFQVAAATESVNTALSTTGNVGIGTAAASTDKLIFNGNISILSSSTISLIFDNLLYNSKTRLNNNNGIGIDSSGVIFSSAGAFRFSNSTFTNILATISSACDLTFGGTIHSGAISTGGSITATNLILGTSNIQTVRNITSTGLIRTTGSVGIGTTNPASKLDVRGGSIQGEGLYIVDSANQFGLFISPPTASQGALIQTIQQGIGYNQKLMLSQLASSH
jgi:hypothetical protein